MNSTQIKSLFRASEIQILYKNKVPYSDRVKIRQPRDAYQTIMHSWDSNKIELVEQFKILLLDRGNNCLGFSEVATGGVTGCIADPKIIFSTLLKAKASAVILFHNHPSCNLEPSQADIELTKRICHAGKILDITVLDHQIVSPYGYCSFVEKGIMPG
jgi:DNA repair protein RadC